MCFLIKSSYSSKEHPWQSGSNTKLKSGIFYLFTRRCPMNLHRKFSPICDRFVMGLPSSEWHCPLWMIFSFMSVLLWSLQKYPWKFLNESLSFLPSFLWPRKTEPRSPSSQSPQQATSDQNCYCTSWAHFSWWPARVTTAHIIQPALALLNSFWQNHYLIKNALTSPINVGSQDQKDFIRKVSVTPNENPTLAFLFAL